MAEADYNPFTLAVIISASEYENSDRLRRRADALVAPFLSPCNIDYRECSCFRLPAWRNACRDALDQLGTTKSLEQSYELLPRAERPNWEEYLNNWRQEWARIRTSKEQEYLLLKEFTRNCPYCKGTGMAIIGTDSTNAIRVKVFRGEQRQDASWWLADIETDFEGVELCDVNCLHFNAVENGDNEEKEMWMLNMNDGRFHTTHQLQNVSDADSESYATDWPDDYAEDIYDYIDPLLMPHAVLTPDDVWQERNDLKLAEWHKCTVRMYKQYSPEHAILLYEIENNQEGIVITDVTQ